MAGNWPWLILLYQFGAAGGPQQDRWVVQGETGDRSPYFVEPLLIFI